MSDPCAVIAERFANFARRNASFVTTSIGDESAPSVTVTWHGANPDTHVFQFYKNDTSVAAFVHDYGDEPCDESFGFVVDFDASESEIESAYHNQIS